MNKVMMSAGVGGIGAMEAQGVGGGGGREHSCLRRSWRQTPFMQRFNFI